MVHSTAAAVITADTTKQASLAHSWKKLLVLRNKQAAECAKWDIYTVHKKDRQVLPGLAIWILALSPS